MSSFYGAVKNWLFIVFFDVVKNMIPDTPISVILESKSDDPSILGWFSDEELATTDYLGRTVLHAAAHKGYPRILTMLLKKLPSMKDQQDSSGKNPVHYAAGMEWETSTD